MLLAYRQGSAKSYETSGFLCGAAFSIGLDYIYAKIIFGMLTICYVMFGGMVATTWLQIVKAVLFLVGGTAVAFLVMMKLGFDSAHGWRRRSAFRPKGSAILTSQFLARDSVSAISPGLALTFGTIGLPHILMRFFTVPDARAARVYSGPPRG